MRADDTDNDALWRSLLTGSDSPIRHDRGRYRRIPGSPRCKTCLYPLDGVVARLLRVRTGRGPSRKNPNYCNMCEEFVRTHPGGCEVEVSLLFADVRGSTPLAERLGPSRFTKLMNRFYRAANKVVIDSDGFVDNFVGDEVVGLYLPLVAAAHPQVAIKAASDLLKATGHADANGPWISVGVGVHTGIAYVGSVGEGQVADFTAMGDACNVTARLASAAAAGEALITADTWSKAGVRSEPIATRMLELKGVAAPVEIRVMKVGPAVRT